MTSDTEYGRDPLGQALAVPVEPVSRLVPSGFDPSRVDPSDSANYETTFYGILNQHGQFWSPMPFDSEQAARDRLARFKGAHLERTHRIIPVRIRLEAIATEAGTAETENTGSVHEGAGPQDIAQPQSVSGLSHTGVDRG